MITDLIEWQKPDGKQWEEQAIARINKATIYIPRNVVHADKIITLDRRKLIECIRTEGYGR